MTKSELKQTALESMSASGAAFQEGDFAMAKDLAEKAWNCYYELQKQRGEDEDFTDLIYYARGQYNKAKEALENQKEEESEEEEFTPTDITIEDYEEDLENLYAKQKEAMLNCSPDSYEVYDTTYGVLIDQVFLAEKRIAQERDCWKNIPMITRFIPGVKIMLRSPHLKDCDRENMLDLSLRAFETIDNPLVPTSPLCYPRLKLKLEELIIQVAKDIPSQNPEDYQDVVDVLVKIIDQADNGNLEAIASRWSTFNGYHFDAIEMTAKYEELAPEADKRGEAAYRMKGDAATDQDFWNAKKLYLAAMGLNWHEPVPVSESEEVEEA